MVKTAMLCDFNFYLADFVVTAARECPRAVRRQKGPAQARVHRLVRRCALHGMRCGAGLLVACLGAGKALLMDQEGLLCWLHVLHGGEDCK